MQLLIEKQSHNRDISLSDYVDKLLAAFTQPAAAPKSAIIHSKSEMIERASRIEPASHIEPAVQPAITMRVEPLSEREREVLKLLCTELSGPEIADHLVISPNTFRTHTSHIFAKLGVNNRRAAVRKAEELDLF